MPQSRGSMVVSHAGGLVLTETTRAVRRDREVEAISDAGVLDRDRERVLVWVPEQGDVDAVAVAVGELAGL